MAETKCRNLKFQQLLRCQKIVASWVKVQDPEENAIFNSENMHSNCGPQIILKISENLKNESLLNSFDKLYTFSRQRPYNFGVLVVLFLREEMVGIVSWLGIIHLCRSRVSSLISFLYICQWHSPGSSTRHFINKKGLKEKALVS